MQWAVLIHLLVASVGAACSPVTRSQGDTHSQAVAALYQPPEPDVSNAASVAVEQFVHQDFFEGVPYEEAARFGSDALPKLKAMLVDPAEVDHWANIVGVVGAIGGRESSEILIGFINSAWDRPLDPKWYRAGLSAVAALGYVRDGGEETAVAYLADIVRKGKTFTPSANLNELRIDPTIAAITAVQALALSGQPSAEMLLSEVAGDKQWSDEVGAADALQTLREVRAIGLSGYLAMSPS